MWSKISKYFNDYDEFKYNCPKLYGPETVCGKVSIGFLNILTIGLAGLMGETNRVVKSVGPTPGSLADYITKRIQGEGKAIHNQNKYFSDTLNKIKNDLDANDSVIALIAWSPMRMHYVNVVAVSDEDDIAILDTNNKFYYYTRSDFEELLDCRSYIPHNFCLDNYNLIRIYKT